MIVRRIARPMLSSIFIVGGLGALRNASAHKAAAEPIVKKVAAPLGLPQDTELLVRANGATMLAGGALLATGKFPRLASTLLIGSFVPVTATHQFWNETDPETKKKERVHFLKNVSLLGGLLLAAVDTEGKPGLAYRAKLAGDSVAHSAHSARREAKIAALQAKSAVH